MDSVLIPARVKLHPHLLQQLLRLLPEAYHFKFVQRLL
jgi:hypothetical protein